MTRTYGLKSTLVMTCRNDEVLLDQSHYTIHQSITYLLLL